MASPIVAVAPAAAAGMALVARTWFYIPYTHASSEPVTVRAIPLGIQQGCCTDYNRPAQPVGGGVPQDMDDMCDTLGCNAKLGEHATLAHCSTRVFAHSERFPHEYADNAWLNALDGGVEIHYGTLGSYRQELARTAYVKAGGPVAFAALTAAGAVHPIPASGALASAQLAAAVAYAAGDPNDISPDPHAPPLPKDAPWRDPTSDQVKTLTSMASQLKLSQWRFNTTPQHFFNLIEGALQPIGLDPAVWVAIIPLMIPTTDTAIRNWVTDYITHPSPRLSWNSARRLFTDRYGQQDYRAVMKKLYQECRQSIGEPVQGYSQRFLSLAAERKVDEKDAVAIHQYEVGLVNGLRRAIDAVRVANRTTGLAPNREWDFTSLQELSQLAIQLETAHNNRNNTLSSSTNSTNPLQSPLANPPDRKRKADKDADVGSKSQQRNNRRVTDTGEKPVARGATISQSPIPAGTTSGTTGKSAEGVTCFRCKKVGHLIRDCPSKQRLTNSNNKFKSNFRHRANGFSNKQQRRMARGARVRNDNRAKPAADDGSTAGRKGDSDK
jgi:Zinc knuckle